MAVTEDRKYSSEFVVNLLEGVKGKTLGEVDSSHQFDRTETKLYYTGKTKSFPSTVALNKLYYFMPYIKGKGIKDLYLIKIARIGNKAEVHKESKDSDPRIVFELEYLESLPNYLPIDLPIFRTYKDTLLGRVMGDFL